MLCILLNHPFVSLMLEGSREDRPKRVQAQRMEAQLEITVFSTRGKIVFCYLGRVGEVKGN